MALRCKEGDLAVILSEGRYTGYIVTVGEFLGHGRIRGISSGEVRDASNIWRVRGIPEITGEEDRYLQPIRPPKVAKTTETKQEIEA